MKLLLLMAALAFPVFAVTDSLTVKEMTGNAQTNYPVQIGRPFVQGEIANCPQTLVGGTPVTTQANVMTRWPDKTVKHAIIAFLIPSLGANATATITFQNQASCNTTALTEAQMLDAAYDFNAEMDLTNGSTVHADARVMLDAASYTVWAGGSVAQTVIIADHSNAATCNSHACSAYDIGFDTDKSFRPIFMATFWPTINKVRVRFVGEISNTESLQDQVYSLSLKTGEASPTEVYTKTSFTHTAMSRWTKQFWIGTTPTLVQIDHNLAYLISTKAIFNYDTTKGTGLAALVSTKYSTWQASSHDIGGDVGLWQKSFATGGDRADVGPYTGWVSDWLYTMDYRTYEIMMSQADLFGNMPINVREGDSARKITKTEGLGCLYQCDVSGMGKPVSIVGRPESQYWADVGGILDRPDSPVPVGTVSDGGWKQDPAHMWDNLTVPYLISGDPWYWEECLNYAAIALWNSSYGSDPEYSRSTSGSYAGIVSHNVRESSWPLRTWAETTNLAPDGTPEKSYLETAINEIISELEGMHNITGTSRQGNTQWTFGYSLKRTRATHIGAVLALDAADNPLRNWLLELSYGPGPVGEGWTNVGERTTTWMDSFVMMALGRAKELGYPTGTLLTWFAPRLTGQLTDAGYNPWLLGEYAMPICSTDPDDWFTTWAAVKAGFPSAMQAETAWAAYGVLYPMAALTAVSFVAGETNGAAAWAWMKANELDVDDNLATDTRWSIIPRTAESGGSSHSRQIRGNVVIRGKVK